MTYLVSADSQGQRTAAQVRVGNVLTNWVASRLNNPIRKIGSRVVLDPGERDDSHTCQPDLFRHSAIPTIGQAVTLSAVVGI